MPRRYPDFAEKLITFLPVIKSNQTRATKLYQKHGNYQ
jgi:hypothetical protein